MTITDQRTNDQQTAIHTATYSPEDNKLRIYASRWLDDDELQELKAAGFCWAPKQELFVAPSWTPGREDLCLKVAGTIEAEETTLAERAEAKADRLEQRSQARAASSNAFLNASHDLVAHIPLGQPILVGHHSEGRHRRTLERSWALMGKAVEADGAAKYWAYQSDGVLAHAEFKNRSDVRERRMKQLFAEMRNHHRNINHGFVCLDHWNAIAAIEDESERHARAEASLCTHVATGALTRFGLWSDFHEKKITAADIITLSLARAEAIINSLTTRRWIMHILNRLAYERDQLGPVARFEGTLTPAIVKGFLREHGAQMPTAKKKGDQWVVTSPVPLPLHIARDRQAAWTEEQLRDLMQSAGYQVPTPKKAAPPILNFRAERIQLRNIFHPDEPFFLEQIEMTKADYNAINPDRREIRLSTCGRFRARTYRTQWAIGAPWACVFLTDSLIHPAPETLQD